MPYFSFNGGHSGDYCRHAKGALRAIVERAVELGFSHYGLSEHCPRTRREDLFEDGADLSLSDTQRLFEGHTREARALRPELVGHLDLIRKFDGPDASFSPAIKRRIDELLELIRDCEGVLDVNCGAHRRGLSPVYPLPSILKRAREIGVRVSLGDDGHGAHDVGVGLDACLESIAAAGYEEIHYLARTGGGCRWAPAPLAEVRPLGSAT